MKYEIKTFFLLKLVKFIFNQGPPGLYTRWGTRAECSQVPQAGPKREVTVQVPRGKANTVQGRFSTSAAEQAFQSARAFSRHVREGHSAAQAAVGLLPALLWASMTFPYHLHTWENKPFFNCTEVTILLQECSINVSAHKGSVCAKERGRERSTGRRRGASTVLGAIFFPLRNHPIWSTLF